MSAPPKVFISATSGDLSSIRQIVKEALLTINCHPVEQRNFKPDWRTVEGMLRAKISDCQALIHIVGIRYGEEPDCATLPPGTPRRSYTQMEYDLGCQFYEQRGDDGFRVYTFICPESFPYDTCDAEPEDKAALQRAHRAAILDSPRLSEYPHTPDDLHARVLALQEQVLPLLHEQAVLGAEVVQARRFGVKAFAVLVLLLVPVLGGLWVVKRGQSHTDKTVAKTGQKLDSLLLRYKQMELALVKLADAEIHAQQLGGNLTPAQLRQRAYTILENELGIPAGELSQELPAFALELYSRSDSQLLMRARAAYALNKLEDAEKLFLESAAQGKQRQENAEKLADEHRNQRIAGLVGAGQSARAQIQYARALEHFTAAAAITDQQRDTAQWADVQLNLGRAHFALGQFDPALVAHEHALQGYSSCLPESDPRVLVSLMEFAGCLRKTGRQQETIPLLERAVAIQGRRLGPSNVAVLGARHDLAMNIGELGDDVKAESMLRELIPEFERVAGKDDTSVLNARSTFANAMKAQGLFAEAAEEHFYVLRARERVLPPNHPDTSRSCYCLALCLLELHRMPEAKAYAHRAYQGWLSAMGQDHTSTKSAKKLLDRLVSMKD